MADTFFVSKLGTSASGAVGVVFSLMAIIQAVGFTLGMGSGSWISRLLGARRDEAANEVASSGFFASIAFGLLLAAFGVAFFAPLSASWEPPTPSCPTRGTTGPTSSWRRRS
jgi:Na+-driven multidrug efflux pump